MPSKIYDAIESQYHYDAMKQKIYGIFLVSFPEMLNTEKTG